MSLANDSIKVTPGSGSTVATFSPGSGSTEYQVVMVANETGHVAESQPSYLLFLPGLTVAAANKRHWELYNQSGSDVTVQVRAIYPIPYADQTNAGVLATRFDFYRTTTISSGGTIANFEASNSTATANFARLDTGDAALQTSNVTAKTTLTSITTGSFLFTTMVFTKETNSSTILHQFNNILPQRPFGKPLVLAPNQGLAALQGTVASVGSVGWLVAFTTSNSS